MRRYVGENIARQMDGDLVPYKDAILFADERTKAALAEKDANYEVALSEWVKSREEILLLDERIAALELDRARRRPLEWVEAKNEQM